VVFDDHFTTISSIAQDDSPPNQWADLCLENSISILEDQETSDKSPMSLNDEWWTTEEMLEKQWAQVQSNSIQQTYNTTSFIQEKSTNPTQSDVTLKIQSTTEAPLLQAHDPKMQSESEDAGVVDSRETPDISMKSDTKGISSRELTTETKNTKDNQTKGFPSNSIPSSSSIPICRSDRINKGKFISTKFENEVFLTDIVQGIDPSSHFGQLCHTSLQTCPSTGHLDTLDQRVYFAQRNLFLSSNPGSPTLYESMNWPQSNQYCEAMQLEIETLERQHTWVSCLCLKDHCVLKVLGVLN
jgi:hypothetical protein